LDTSPLGLCWKNKALLPANLPQRLVSQLANARNISWGLIRDCGDGELSPPLSPGASPWTTRRRSHQAPMDSLIQRGIQPPSESRWGPQKHKGTHWGTGTNLGASLFILEGIGVQIQTCLRRQKGSLITSQRPLVTACWGETLSLRFRERGRSIVPCGSVYKREPETQPSCKVSEKPWSSVPWWTLKIKGEP
jgi:hypothetical protein